MLVNDTIWDATLNQSDSTANANKFYRIQVVFQTEGDAVNYFTWTRWGRVGEKGHTALKLGPTLDAATRVFEKKFKDKSGLKWEDRYMNPKSGKYTFIDRSYEEDDDDDEKKVKNESNAKKPPVESQLPWPVQNLMSFIFNQDNFLSAMKAMDYDAEKLPLGKLSERTLKQGFSVLKDLSELIIHPELAVTKYSKTFYKAAESLSNQYFTIIPHVFGRNRPPVLSTGPLIKKEVELLEALTDMDVANDIMKEALDVDEVNQLDQQFKGLGLKEMSQRKLLGLMILLKSKLTFTVDHNTKEFQELSNYLKKSSGSTHNIRYQVSIHPQVHAIILLCSLCSLEKSRYSKCQYLTNFPARSLISSESKEMASKNALNNLHMQSSVAKTDVFCGMAAALLTLVVSSARAYVLLPQRHL